MERKDFIKKLSFGTMALTSLPNLKNTIANLAGEKNKMPVLFLGHGSPMNAIEDNIYTQGWKKIAAGIPTPKAILCVSAHWLTRGTKVTAMEKPKTIHDFGGFPDELFNTQYPASGSPAYADKVVTSIQKTKVEKNMDWGLDHGTWSVLLPMYPKADIPVFQLSIDYSQPPQYHYDLASELKLLRNEGILIIGSGNIVHNLGMLRFDHGVYDWTPEFDSAIKKFISNGDYSGVINYQKLGEAAKMAVPTNEHFLPLVYALGASDKEEPVSFYNENYQMGSISMTSLRIG